MSVTVTWPMVLPSVANLREHWSKRAKRNKIQRQATRLALFAYGVQQRIETSGGLASLKRLAVRLTRIAPRKLDDDNLQGAFKAIRDEVAAYFGVDDADPRIRFEYAQAKGKASVRIDFAVEDDARTRAELAAADTHARIAGILEAHDGR